MLNSNNFFTAQHLQGLRENNCCEAFTRKGCGTGTTGWCFNVLLECFMACVRERRQGEQRGAAGCGATESSRIRVVVRHPGMFSGGINGFTM